MSDPRFVLPDGYTQGIPPTSGRYIVILRAIGGWWLADSPRIVTFTVTPELAIYVNDEADYPWATLEARTSGNWRLYSDDVIAWREVPHV